MREHVPARHAPRAIALLWHGRGPDEGHVLDALAVALRERRFAVLAPDWDSTAADAGERALRSSLAEAHRLAERNEDVPVVVVGWSLGGTAALSLALNPASEFCPAAVVGLAADTRACSPLDGTVPADLVSGPLDHLPPPIRLVHGRADTVVPVEAAVAFAEASPAGRVLCSLEVVDSDHAGVIGTAYDATQQVCIPSDHASAVYGLAAAVRAVDAALAGHGRA